MFTKLFKLFQITSGLKTWWFKPWPLNLFFECLFLVTLTVKPIHWDVNSEKSVYGDVNNEKFVQGDLNSEKANKGNVNSEKIVQVGGNSEKKNYPGGC